MIKLCRVCVETCGRLSSMPIVIGRGTQNVVNYSAATEAKPATQKQVLLQLRKDTGFPLMKCKQALVKTNYDVEQAIESLNQDAAKEGWEKMHVLSGRKANQGLVTAFRVDDHAVILEINCESDFVAKTSDFQNFVALVAKTAIEHYSPSKTEQLVLCPEEIMKLPIQSKTGNVENALAKVVGKVKENIHISRGVLTSVNGADNEIIGIYTHPDLGTPPKGGKLPLMGRFAAVVGIKCQSREPQGPGWLLGKARDLAQHVIGMNPTCIGTRDTPSGTLEEAPSVVEQKLPSFHQDENSLDDTDEFEMRQYSFDSEELLKQSFLLDETITVQNWLDINQFAVKYFVRYQLGGEEYQ